MGGRHLLLGLGAVLAATAAQADDEPDQPDRPLPELEYEADADDDAETLDDEAADYGTALRPWRIAPWIPLNWRSNLAQQPRALRSGVAFEPEVKLLRSWGLGPVRLLTEANAAVSRVPSDAIRNSSSWWFLAEAATGNAARGAAPYASYEPLTLHDGVFGSRILTFHTMTAGIRRQWGTTNLNAYFRRRDSTVDALDRTLVGAQLSHTVPLGNGNAFNIRTDAEFRRYDQNGDTRRQDMFVRARARLFIPLSASTDLVLNADLQRNQSNLDAFRTTSVVLGPVISASFGL
jgi:hypothetical protein